MHVRGNGRHGRRQGRGGHQHRFWKTPQTIVLFANITSLSSKAIADLKQDPAQVVMLAEHHVVQSKAKWLGNTIRSMDRRPFAAFAQGTIEHGSQGGILIAPRKHISVSKSLGWTQDRYGVFSNPSSCRFSASMQLNGKVPIILCAGYHRNGMDDDIWRQWSRDTNGGRLLFIGAADFNISREQVRESPWLGLLDAALVDFDGITCSSGDGRAIDFVVVSKSLLPQVKVSVEWGHPWSPHAALRITLRWDLEAMHKWVPKRPSQWSLGGLHQLPTADFDDILLQTKEKLARDPQFSAASIHSQQYWS